MIEYIRKTYKVPAKRGGKIKYEGKDGVIVGSRLGYLRIKINGKIGSYHPTYNLEYLNYNFMQSTNRQIPNEILIEMDRKINEEIFKSLYIKDLIERRERIINLYLQESNTILHTRDRTNFNRIPASAQALIRHINDQIEYERKMITHQIFYERAYGQGVSFYFNAAE